ncbi:unnamed protein product, partial [marine sediment metagenome]
GSFGSKINSRNLNFRLFLKIASDAVWINPPETKSR